MLGSHPFRQQPLAQAHGYKIRSLRPHTLFLSICAFSDRGPLALESTKRLAIGTKYYARYESGHCDGGFYRPV